MLIYVPTMKWRKTIRLDQRPGRPETHHKPQLTQTLEFVSAPGLYAKRTTAQLHIQEKAS